MVAAPRTLPAAAELARAGQDLPMAQRCGEQLGNQRHHHQVLSLRWVLTAHVPALLLAGLLLAASGGILAVERRTAGLRKSTVTALSPTQGRQLSSEHSDTLLALNGTSDQHCLAQCLQAYSSCIVLNRQDCEANYTACQASCSPAGTTTQHSPAGPSPAPVLPTPPSHGDCQMACQGRLAQCLATEGEGCEAQYDLCIQQCGSRGPDAGPLLAITPAPEASSRPP